MAAPRKPEAAFGPRETKIRAELDALMTAHPFGDTLAEMAIGLARKLDGELLPLAVAGINKELRETLNDLVKLAEGDDSLAHALSQPV